MGCRTGKVLFRAIIYQKDWDNRANFAKNFVTLQRICNKRTSNKMATTTSNTTDDKTHEAVLSSAEGFTAFSFGGYHIRFRAPYSLERYVNVVSWDDGYLVVMAKYSHNAEPEEEYIDLKPILEGLYIDSAAFLKSIKSVRIAYA